MKRINTFTMVLLGGCTLHSIPLSQAQLVVRPEIISGRLTQTVVSPYTASSIHHLVLKLFTQSENDLGIQKSLSNADTNKVVSFTNLRANTAYRIRAYAYKASDESPENLISTSDSNSYTDVTLTSDDHPTLLSLKVKLIDLSFNGQGTSSLSITAGGYSSIASESLSVPLLGYVQTLAGNGEGSYADGYGTSAKFKNPVSVYAASDGNLYVTDYGNHRIRRISSGAQVSTFAGSGVAGNGDGTGTSASFSYPTGIIQDSSGNFYVADYDPPCIRKITSAGVVSTIAGNGTVGWQDGTGSAATFNHPHGLAFDKAGNLYVTEAAGCRIRKITPAGVVSTVAGNGTAGCNNANGISATFNSPYAIAIDATGTIYVADGGNNRIRVIATSGNVTTLAGNGQTGLVDGIGTAAQINSPTGIVLDLQGNLLVSGGNSVRKVTPTGVVTTIAGNGSPGATNGLGTAASFNTPDGITVDTYGMVYLVDFSGSLVRAIH